MAIFQEVQCGKCDRRYSAFRSRCPYCGARRGSKGKYANDPSDMRGKMIIGGIIVVALLAAVIALLVISIKNDPETDSPSSAISPVIPNEDDVVTVTGAPIEVSPTPPEESFVPPPPSVQAVYITYAGNVKEDITEPVGTTLTLKVKIVPEDTDLVPVWTSSNPAVFDVVPDDTTGMTAKVTMLSSKRDGETLTVTVGDKSAECIIRVR